MITVLDGPLGTELAARGIPTPPPAWSAAALRTAPDVIRDIHRTYARAGATVHTAATFRTRPADVGDDWAALAALAVALAREGVPPGHRVAGSLAPIADCYRPDLSPSDPRPQHRALARVLADAAVDLILCETFPHVGEALVAAEEAVATGIETWVSLTAGPGADLLDADAIARSARGAVDRGARAVLVNCVPSDRTLPLLSGLRGLGVPFGAYANAGAMGAGIGWGAGSEGARRYLEHARAWVDAGATIVGACCGAGPAHVRALADAFAGSTAS